MNKIEQKPYPTFGSESPHGIEEVLRFHDSLNRKIELKITRKGIELHLTWSEAQGFKISFK